MELGPLVLVGTPGAPAVGRDLSQPQISRCPFSAAPPDLASAEG